VCALALGARSSGFPTGISQAQQIPAPRQIHDKDMEI
jgi:hypothetical protein